MKLGVSYGVFSGLELLKPSLRNIREFAYHIVLVWSPVSSTGEPAVPYMLPLLQSLVAEGLADELIEFRPSLATSPGEMQDNCRTKREVGRIRCRMAGCTHHLIRDCDEFHDPDQFRSRWEEFQKVDVTITPIREYIQHPTRRIKGLSPLHVPCVHRIESSLRRLFVGGVTVDVGRTVHPMSRFVVCREDELVLHHFTGVRYNSEELARKYQGHGHLHRVGTPQDWLDRINLWDPEQLETVPDSFGILDYWREEFPQWLK